MKVSGIRLELTDACNLRCKHCLRKHARPAHYLPVNSIRKLIAQVLPYRIKEVWLTGGEPTLHPQFEEIIAIIAGSGCAFTVFTNGLNFTRTAKVIGRYRKNLQEVRFSLDGASRATHDLNRGKGSFSAVMRAAQLCRQQKFPFSFNAVISRLNKTELAPLVRLAVESKSAGINFAHLQLTDRPLRNGLALSAQEGIEAEKVIRRLQKRFPKAGVHVCAGSYVKNPLLLCPVPLASFYVDCRGNLNFCALLSNLNSSLGGAQKAANLSGIPLARAYQRLLKRYSSFAAAHMREFFSRRLNPVDHFPCAFCLEYFKKTHA